MTFRMTDARLVSLVIASSEGPVRLDIAIQSHPLDGEDPMGPGDVMLWANGDVLLWADESDADDPGAKRRIADALEAAAAALRGAQ
jgi:hypothetical protein